jgi:Protein of unknown function (DUF3037)
MQEEHLFEYAVIRVVPRVEREEFLNVGVILYCRDRNFLQAMFTLDEHRLCAMCSTMDIEELKKHLLSVEAICNGAEDGGPIARLDIASRFRWLTARRSTVVQTSVVHPGLCSRPQEELARLYNQLVL